MLFAFFGATALLIGCHDYRGEECRAFVIAVNSKLEEIDRVTSNYDPSHNVSAEDMRHLAELYESLAKKTQATHLDTKELAQLRAQYHAMVLEAAKLARKVADALDAKDLETAMKAHERFGAVVSKEDILVGQVNAFCQSR
jgi:DNA-binding transcriptional regulator YbjK